MVNMRDPEEVNAAFDDIVRVLKTERAHARAAAYRGLRHMLTEGRITEEEFDAEIAKLHNGTDRPR